MPGFGYGFGFRKAQRVRGGGETPPPAPVPTIAPGPAWTGVAGSGYSTLPTDPARVTAKPAMQLLVAPDQHFSDELLVGVVAGANNAGSLYENMGLSHVRLHCEGSTLDIAAPSFTEMVDANGIARQYFGWWSRIVRPEQASGELKVYFEAVPADASMQNRVIGPYAFHATSEAHDLTVEVAVTPGEIPGQRYRTLTSALEFCRQQAAQNPLVTITEGGSYVLGQVFSVYAGTGYCTIAADQPATIVGTGGDASFVAYRPKYKGLRFRGENLSIDFALTQVLYYEPAGAPRQFWFDGCRLVNSEGRNALFRKGLYDATGYLAGGSAIFTECHISELSRVAQKALLVRGCTFSSTWSDLFNSANCVVHNLIEDHDSSWFRSDHHAMTIAYNGPAPSATFETSGSRIFIAKEDGVEVGRFSVGTAYADWLANTNFSVANVVDWVNDVLPAGWSATLHDDTHRAANLSTAGRLGSGMPAPVNVKNTPLDLYASWDVHADIYQKQDTGTTYEENIVMAFNRGFGLNAQDFFLTGTPGIRDMLVFNNAFANDEPVGDRSQLARNHHVVIANNSLSTQGLWLRSDTTYIPDSYSLLANNVAPEISWNGQVTGDAIVAGNHVQAASTATPQGTTSGGNKNNLFASADSGNFAPKGALLSNLKSSVIRHDLNGKARDTLSPAGAVTS